MIGNNGYFQPLSPQGGSPINASPAKYTPNSNQAGVEYGMLGSTMNIN